MQFAEAVADMLVRLRDDERSYLALDLGLSATGFARTRLVQVARTPAWVIRGEEVEEWRPLGFTEHQGAFCLYGPDIQAVTLHEVLHSRSGEQALGYLNRLARALTTATHNGFTFPRIATFGVWFLNDGGVLLLPRQLVDTICESLPRERTLEMVDRFNHPDYAGEKALDFALAALTYTATVGRYPYGGMTLEELRERMRDRPPTEPLVVRPELKPRLAEALTSSLSPERAAGAGIERWPHLLEDLRSAGLYVSGIDEEHERLLREAERREKRFERSYHRAGYLRRNGFRLVVSALVIALVGGVAGNIIYQQLQPRSISGYAPEEVVRVFYESINTLNHETMQEAVVDGAGRQEIDQVMRMYVGSRVRLAMEHREGFLNAQDWRDQGKPEIEPGEMLFGIAELEIEHLDAEDELDPEEEQRFIARYERWYVTDTGEPGEPEPGEAELGTGNGEEQLAPAPGRPPEIEGYRHEDRLYLRRDREDWVIYRIENLVTEPIDVPEPVQ